VATCAQILSGPGGEQLVALNSAVTDLSTCMYVVQSGADLASVIPPLSVDDGLLIGSAIMLVWALAWGGSVLHRLVDPFQRLPLD